jgi:hypothetical protein
VHRDIKPANIWLSGDEGPGARGEDTSLAPPQVKLLDFGLARAADETEGLTATGMLAGTPAYMAPEQVDGRTPDARCDLFGLGATLYQCVGGQRPFNGPTRTAILRAVTDHEPPPHEVNPAVGRSLSALVMRLLDKDPAARPQSAQEVAAALTTMSEQPETIAWHPAPRPRRSRRALATAAGVGVLLAAAAGGLFLLRNRDAARPQAVGPPTPPVAPEGPSSPPAPVRYRGRLDVLVERADADGAVRLLRLNQAGALPLRKTDKFRIEGEVEPPAYLYLVWVDPGHDVTPVYPWNPEKGWGSRPAQEGRVGRVSLPGSAGNRYTAPDARPGVATMVLFARPTPLDVSDDVVRKWFEGLPELPLPAGGEQAAVWFDNYVEARDPDRPRTFGVVGSEDAFARWQGRLQKVLGDHATFATAASFARTGRK